jgi:CheY-like chemotaxis protein/HPt (histidine-containing phosphotransfer) domain-containing protein
MAEHPETIARNRRLLVVGDPALGRTLIKTVLSRLGYVVSTVATAAEALAMLAHTRFALVMIATTLPDLQGRELARRIRQRGSRLPQPLLVLFGDGWSGAEDAELADACLQKPLSITRLVSTVQQLTERVRQAEDRDVRAAIDAPLDRQRLRTFTDGDAQLEAELASLFLSTAAMFLDRLQAASDQPEAWREQAHALKGACANIGATKLAALAAEAESTAPSAARLAAMRAELQRIAVYLDERQLGECPA